jgi:DMSO/TMAO reductase YedYZ molybdopterin-dependent catalytic subunit
VTRWSKLGTAWRGVSVDTLLAQVEHDATYVLAFCDGGYSSNLPITDVTGGQAWVAFGYDGQPLESEHGGPARLLVPHLYFWKSAKWVRGLELARALSFRKSYPARYHIRIRRGVRGPDANRETGRDRRGRRGAGADGTQWVVLAVCVVAFAASIDGQGLPRWMSGVP